jgi:chemotaxis protein CheD
MPFSKAPARPFLYPGGIFVDPEPQEVMTVLGSCISVCLWDTVLKIGGINHYLLPFWNGNGLASARYGNIAIDKLIERMCETGSIKRNLRAKVFGGSLMLVNAQPSTAFRIGELNANLAFQSLKEKSIPVLSHNVGGSRGRKIIFSTGTGEVLMKYVNGDVLSSLSTPSSSIAIK